VEALADLLHERIRTHCLALYRNGHPKHAALEAMIQVELALKERSGVTDKFGVTLCRSLFGPSKSIKLRVPLGEEYQEPAQKLFEGAFAYYRNYAAHDGAAIDTGRSARIMILASELLDLIGASPVSFADVGIDGLVGRGPFDDRQYLVALLTFLDGYTIADDVVDGFFEELREMGMGEAHVQAAIETGLVEYKTKVPRSPGDPPFVDPEQPDEASWFELTEVGRALIQQDAGGTPG
jgi:uncharacterized protein (TIGR02391 family)